MIAGVDIGGTKIAVGMIDENGRVLSRLETATDAAGGYANALDRTAGMLREAARLAQVQIKGIGIGSTGPIDPLTGEIGFVNFFPTWKGENPVRDLARIFQVSVAIENDADAAALAEAHWGAGRHKKRLIYITVGTGIGGGIILDGVLYRGADHAHPEIGHHVIDPSGPACMCGFHGCWESLAAGPAMVAWLESKAPQDYAHRAGLTAKKSCELARQGDEWARRAVDREAYYLGLGLANLVTLFTPDAIVLSGSVMKSADLFLDQIRKTICTSCGFVPYEKTELGMASLGDDTNLIGAARVWYHRFASSEAQVGR
ncbi:MAG TPA: ROK family protein [Terriglobales bacterium]|jgi:glucokinase